MNKYEKYLDGFLEASQIKEKEIFINHVKKMEKIDKFITDWNDNDLDELIILTNSISMNAVNKYLQYTRDFYSYICELKGDTPKKMVLTKNFKHYINYGKFEEITLSEKAFNWLLKELVPETFDGEFNFRDRVMVRLAWEGLTSDEIKNLKISDINIVNDNKVILHLGERDITIESIGIGYDIEQTKEQNRYYIPESLHKREQWRNLKPSTHLIKPVVTRQSDNECVSNPSQLIKNVLKKMDIGVIAGIELGDISLEDIKRSSIINCFMNGMDVSEVKEKFRKKTECDLYWLQEIAQALKNK